MTFSLTAKADLCATLTTASVLPVVSSGRVRASTTLLPGLDPFTKHSFEAGARD